MNTLIEYIWLPYTQKNAKNIQQPNGIIIGKDMLKFHNIDRRELIRERILEKNFDK